MNINGKHITSGITSHITWSAATLPKKGEEKCGDKFVIKEYRDKILVAAIDGLGHGDEAAKASQEAVNMLQSFTTESLITIVNRCHKELRDTRGVVMSLALFDIWDRTMSWISIGNVDGVFLRTQTNEHRKNKDLVLRGGVVGYKLPPLQAAIFEVSPGDMLIFTTDGVESDYIDRVNNQNSPEEIVEYIASDYFKATDDALILVARYIGDNI